MPPTIRVNSVAVSVAQWPAVGRRLRQDDIVQTLVDLSFRPDQIAGIQFLPHRRIVVVKFVDKEDYLKFLSLEAVNVNGVSCRLYDLSSLYTTVNIMSAPFEMGKQELIDILRCYGDVKNIRQRLLTCELNKSYNAIPDGTWLASMDIIKPIPSYLMLHDNQLFIKYPGQDRTCRLCQSTEHLARDCTRAPQVKASIPNPTDFPTLAEANMADSLPRDTDQRDNLRDFPTLTESHSREQTATVQSINSVPSPSRPDTPAPSMMPGLQADPPMIDPPHMEDSVDLSPVITQDHMPIDTSEPQSSDSVNQSFSTDDHTHHDITEPPPTRNTEESYSDSSDDDVSSAAEHLPEGVEHLPHSKEVESSDEDNPHVKDYYLALALGSIPRASAPKKAPTPIINIRSASTMAQHDTPHTTRMQLRTKEQRQCRIF